MHSRNVSEAINPKTAAFRKIGVHKWVSEDTRHYWRKVTKRNGGRKVKSLRTHRTGR